MDNDDEPQEDNAMDLPDDEASSDIVAQRILEDFFSVTDALVDAFANDVSNLALLGRIGDRLDTFFRRATRFRIYFTGWEWDDLERSVSEMRLFLHRQYDEAMAESHTPAPRLIWTEQREGQGRPSKCINFDFLNCAVQFYGPSKIARYLRCDKKTVSKEITRYGLVHTWDHRLRVHDEENIQHLVLDAVARNPNYGARMLQAAIKATSSLNVARQKILDTMPNKRPRHRRHIERRKYSVPGPNSLWHHDGQHGLIHWGIVIHAFVDGFSRYITGIRAASNNRAETVKRLFLDACAQYMVPLRVRGDHGVENLQVAAWINRFRGYRRSSYIWGSSVHNTRIERLWREVTYYVGHKWYLCFMRMEKDFFLKRSNRNHIWLLHQLFLNTITNDLLQFATDWNMHKIRIPGHHQSPSELYHMGQWIHGFRGDPLPLDPDLPERIRIEHDDELTDNNVIAFGVGWEDLNGAEVGLAVTSLEEENSWVGRNAQPSNLNRVEVRDPTASLTEEQMNRIWERTGHWHNSTKKEDILNMWVEAIALAHSMEPNLF